MIAITLGDRGAILATPDRQIVETALPVEVRSSVGAGDSFLAGLVLGLARQQPAEDALRLAIATGAAAVMSRGTARVTREQVETLLAGALVHT
jgi:6-phosphofructokinase 2